MVDFTTELRSNVNDIYIHILPICIFYPSKAKCFAIAYFRVACYSINWIHNLRINIQQK
jgi:hypothetical protein